MSTITEIENTDSPSSSIGVINTNFDNLNTDKIEADSVDTLENKSIDADDNTITNLDTDTFASSSKTGQDTKVVTGTAGSTDALAKWDANGDLVSALKSLTTTQPSAGSDDTTVPTSKAVYDLVAETIGAKERFFLPSKGADAVLSVTGQLSFMQLDSAETGYFSFSVPQDFTTLSSVDLIIYPDATESLQMDVVVSFGAIGEAYNANSTTVSNTTKSVTTTLLTAWNLDTLTGSPFSGLSAGDIVSISINSDTTLTRIIGLRFRYT